MRGLLPIDGDMERIESIARSAYAGPVAHRLEVASRFMSDPIGIIRVDLATRTAGEHEHEHD